jgi:hypothetical protein
MSPYLFASTTSLRPGTRAFLLSACLVLGCGSDAPSDPGPVTPPAGGCGSGGGRNSAGGAGGGGAGGGETTPDAAPGGSGGAAGGGGGGGAGGGAGAGGSPAPADAGGGDAAPAVTPPGAADPPLPACLRMVPVAGSAALGAALAGAQPGDCLVLADGNFTFPVIG